MEPIQAKGGILALIPKTGGAQPQNYRGIMLLGTLSKRLHALLRKQLLPTLIAHKPQGQIGGFPHQQVTYGAQAVGIFTRVVSNAGLSSAVIYFDLKNAFHKLVRELVLGVRHDAAFEQVVNMLTTEQVDPRGVQAWSKLPGLLQRLHAPPLLTQLLADVHHHTWFILPNHPRITLTRKGTRPGSPLADVIFHALMLDITIEIENWLDQQRDYCSIREELSLPMPAVVWSDDLAICWASRSAQNLVPGIQDLISIVHQIFSRRGFSLNMNYGKTMAVPHFRGEKAPALRKEFVLTANPGVLCPLRDGDSQWLHFASKYKHLGVYQSADGGFGPELHYRCGVAHSTFVALAKPILCNRHLPVRVRINLYRMMVLTKLFFGLGIWPTPTLRQLDKLFHLVGRHLRKILACGKDTSAFYIPDQQAFDEAGLPHPRIQLAMDRLLYIQKLYSEGPSFLRQLVQSEHLQRPDSWLHGVFADIEWLRTLIPEQIPIEWASDLTGAFEFWEASGQEWRVLVKRAFRRHQRQEQMMFKIHQLHRDIFKVLECTDGELLPRPDQLAGRGSTDYECFCGRSFATPQGLALHRRKKHGIHAPEHQLIDGATCPCCLKFFWTSQRLYQHLAYISRKTLRNPCFQQLIKTGYQAEFASLSLPGNVTGLGRVDALQTLGPLPDMTSQDARVRVHSRVGRTIGRLQGSSCGALFPWRPKTLHWPDLAMVQWLCGKWTVLGWYWYPWWFLVGWPFNPPRRGAWVRWTSFPYLGAECPAWYYCGVCGWRGRVHCRQGLCWRCCWSTCFSSSTTDCSATSNSAAPWQNRRWGCSTSACAYGNG